MIGRKSTISHENKTTQHEVHSRVKTDYNYHSLVLDICGAHKPVSRFLIDKEFNYGIWFIIAIRKLEKIVAVEWADSYDALRTILGNDENIIGRNCVLSCKSARDKDLKYGKIIFNETKRNFYQDEQRNTYHSIGGFFGVVANHGAQFVNHESNSLEGSGETWRPIK